MDIQKTIENFRKKGYEVSYFDTAKEASEYLNKEIDGVTVSSGGSMTINEMGLIESLSKHNRYFSHWNVPEGMTAQQVLEQAMHTDVYLLSVNGAGETGELVNIDGTGNRISSSLYGHKKVYYIIGINKFAPDLHGAIDRARNVASPLNAKRLGKKTPCAEKGEKCYDCSSPERICNAMNIQFRKVGSCEEEIVIVGEKLGY
ncbi:MAG: lactate utilization protein [Oscillospiraceae bacterium]|nr:lactate utilization protein [Oscillospiraceae bacterium]